MQQIKPDLIKSLSLLNKDTKFNNNDKNNIIQKYEYKTESNQNKNIKKNIWIEAYGCSANIADS